MTKNKRCSTCSFWRPETPSGSKYGDCVIYLGDFFRQENIDFERIGPLLFEHDFLCHDWKERKQ